MSYLTGISGCFLGRLKPSPEPLSIKTSVKTAVGSSSPFAPCLVRTTCVVDSTAVMVLPRGVNARNWQIRTMKKVAIIRTAIRNNVSRRLRGCSVASEAVRLRLPLCFDMLKLRRSRQRPIQRCVICIPASTNGCKHYYQRILKHMVLAIDENFVTSICTAALVRLNEIINHSFNGPTDTILKSCQILQPKHDTYTNLLRPQRDITYASSVNAFGRLGN